MGTLPGLDGEIINIGPDEETVTINELANVLAELLGFDLDPIFIAARPQEVHDARCSAVKRANCSSTKPPSPGAKASSNHRLDPGERP